MPSVPRFVAILMGSESDRELMQRASDALSELGIESETNVLSAHRRPEALVAYIRDAEARDVGVFICGAGLAAALPGVVAAHTDRPVIGVPIESGGLGGMDSLLSIVQMPPGVPVACVAVNGARNAGYLAAQMIGLGDPEVAKRFVEHKQRLAGG
jgi:5-(carboxyamino)imidazole ribonucleotide mutase